MSRRQCVVRLALRLAFFAGLLAACGPRAPSEPQPPDILYGQDQCEACGMLIDAPRFAAATLTEAGQVHKFDDTGEMFSYQAAHAGEKVRAWFVHDYATETWLRGEAAYFVRDNGPHSPMSSGWVAFAERSAAETFARASGAEVLAFPQAQQAAVTPPSPQP